MSEATAMLAPSRTSSTGQAVERLLDFEEVSDALDVEFDGWLVWPLFRAEVAVQAAGLVLGRRGMPPWPRRLAAIADLWRLTRSPRHDTLARTYSSGLQERTTRGFRDIWIDHLFDLDHRVFKLESIDNPLFLSRRQQALYPPSATTSLMDLVASRLARRSTSANVEADRCAARLEPMCRAMGATQMTRESIAARLRGFYWSKRAFGWLLDRVEPSRVIVADPGEHELKAAAKERSIRVYEYQHGTLDSMFYSWTRTAVARRARLPMSDVLLLFGEHARTQVRSWTSFWSDAELQLAGSRRIDEYRLRRHRVAHGFRHVVFTAQGLDETAAADLLAVAAPRIAAAGLGLIVKLHPSYGGGVTSPFDRLAPGVQVYRADEGPSTFELLSTARAHVSISSTCHFDALGIGVPTAALDLTTHEIMLPLVNAGHAELIRSADDLVRWLSNAPVHVAPEISEFYFEPDAIALSRRLFS